MKRIISLIALLLSIWLLSGIENNAVLGDELVMCNLDEYRNASASDIMLIDLSNQDCDVVGNDIMEFTQLLVLDISKKQLESQSILSAFPNLLALNAEYSNLNTLEYISTTIENLYVSNSDIHDLRMLENYNLVNYSFDYLELDSVSRDILKTYDSTSRLMPLIAKVTINNEVYDCSHITKLDLISNKLKNELIVEYDGNDTYELTIMNDTRNEEVVPNNGVFIMDSNNVYRVTYGDSEYIDEIVIELTYKKVVNTMPEIVVPIVTTWRVTTAPQITSVPSTSEEHDNEGVEENIRDNEDIEDIVDEDIIEEPIIKNTADQPILIKLWYYILKMLVYDD